MINYIISSDSQVIDVLTADGGGYNSGTMYWDAKKEFDSIYNLVKEHK
jgi:hypothetical protein